VENDRLNYAKNSIFRVTNVRASTLFEQTQNYRITRKAFLIFS